MANEHEQMDTLTPDGMCELQSLSERFPTNAKQISPDVKITLQQIINVWSRGNRVKSRKPKPPVLEMDLESCFDVCWKTSLAEKRGGRKKKRNDGERQLGHWLQLRPWVDFIHKPLAVPSLLLGSESNLWNGHLASAANYCKALVLMNVLPQQFWFNCTVKMARSKHLAN